MDETCRLGDGRSRADLGHSEKSNLVRHDDLSMDVAS
jgi:hypothetical protein